MMTSRNVAPSLLLATFLLLTGCLLMPSADAAQRTRASMTLSRVSPVANEQFTVSGRLSTRFRRPVTLRVSTGRAWRPLRHGFTTRSGGYRFTGVATARTGWFSVSVPAARHAGHLYTKVATRVRRVVPVTQRGSLDVLPPVAQRGTSPAGSAAARGSVVARFTPARPGRRVWFRQQRRDGAWSVVATTTQGADGRAYFIGATSTPSRALRFKATTKGASGAASVTTAAGSGDWDVSFDDEFDGSSLDLAKWSYREGAAASRTHTSNDRRAVSVGAGALRLRVMPDPAHPRTRLLTSQISTEDSFRATYGMFSARIRFERGMGQHGSFWLQSPRYGRFPGDAASSGSEVDVVEFFGKGYPGGGLADFLYYADAKGHSVRSGKVWPHAGDLLPATDTWWNGYHVFSVRWTPSGYTFYVDGRVLSTSDQALSRTDEYLILSLLVSDWEIDHLDRSALPSSMAVDWAKVWQSPSSS
jgi:beta-glucanase (GH16 family)